LAVHHRHRRSWIGVASFFGSARSLQNWLAEHTARLRRYAVHVIGKAGSMDGRERVIGKREITCQREIVGNVLLGELAEAQVIAVQVTGRNRRAALYVELVHPSKVERGDRTLPGMTKIPGQLIGGMLDRNDLTRRQGCCRGPVGARECSKIMIK